MVDECMEQSVSSYVGVVGVVNEEHTRAYYDVDEATVV
jgi:hypothetical protein